MPQFSLNGLSFQDEEPDFGQVFVTSLAIVVSEMESCKVLASFEEVVLCQL
jgi:hypothetical protein